MNNIIECDFAQIDHSKYPIIEIQVKKVDPTKYQLKEFFSLLAVVFDMHQGDFVIAVDGRDIGWMNKVGRTEVSKGIRKLEIEYVHRLQKTFYYMPNLLARAVFRGINFVIDPMIPQVIGDSWLEILDKCDYELKNSPFKEDAA